MTIQEAILSDKPFRLPHHDSFTITRLVEGRRYFFHEVTNTNLGFFDASLILSDKWEVKDIPANVIKFVPRSKIKKASPLGTPS